MSECPCGIERAACTYHNGESAKPVKLDLPPKVTVEKIINEMSGTYTEGADIEIP